jgi:cupin domain
VRDVTNLGARVRALRLRRGLTLKRLVIRGALEVDVGGEVFALDAGDALHFDAAAPHRLRRTGGGTTRALYVAAC